MSGFFDKLKQGAQEAGKKAQVTVEVNRLKMQISSLQKEIARLYALIGETVHQEIDQGATAEDFTLPESCLAWSRDVVAKQQEIAQIEERIHELRDEIICSSCQQVNSRENKFCSGCGAKLEISAEQGETIMIEEGAEGVIDTVAACPACEHPLIPGKKFCGHCGHAIEQ